MQGARRSHHDVRLPMKLAVYVPDSRPYPYVLTPDCLQPSLACEHEFGRLHLMGVVKLEDDVLPAIAHPSSGDVEFEYVIFSGYGMLTIESLLERAGKGQRPPASA